jgi:hypothetical protein
MGVLSTKRHEKLGIMAKAGTVKEDGFEPARQTVKPDRLPHSSGRSNYSSRGRTRFSGAHSPRGLFATTSWNGISG